MKKFVSLLLALLLIVTASVPGFAFAGNDVGNKTAAEESALTDARAIAIHAPARFTPTADWTETAIQITKESPIYDVNGDLYAYCFDLKNTAKNERAYILISISETDFPVIGYAPSGVSPYFDLSDDETAVYLTVGDAYIDTGSSYTSLTSGYSVSKADILGAHTNTAISLQCAEDYSDVRQMFVEGNFHNVETRAIRLERNLTDVPNWQWDKGCVPTAMGMILSYHYGWSKSSIMPELRRQMNTNSNGMTLWANAMTGTKRFLNSKNITPTTCEWHYAVMDWPWFGSQYNPKNIYKEQIDLGNPVLVACEKATDGSPQYSQNGFQDHGMAGVGYMFSEVDGDYIIVHTTATEDGDWYVSLQSSGFKKYAWGIFEP